MFKSLLKTLTVKQQRLGNTSHKNSEVQTIVRAFLSMCFGDEVQQNCRIEYRSRDDQLVIATGSRVVAADLQLRRQELANFLKDNKISLKQLSIIS